MSKVVISFLGTGGYQDQTTMARSEYRVADYQIDSSEIYTTEFVSDALMKHYKADKIICIGTLKSMWDVMYDKFIEHKTDKIWEDIYNSVHHKWNSKTEIEEANFVNEAFAGSRVRPVFVKYGMNAEENEYNVVQILKIDKFLEDGDQLYVDITHGFRSLPLILTNVLNYLSKHSRKNIQLEQISYGMFEVSGEYNGITPIVDLNIIKDLQQTVKAAHEFKEYGEGYIYSKILKSKSDRILFKEYCENMSLNNISGIKSNIARIKGIKSENLSGLQQLVIPESIENLKQRFSDKLSASQFEFELALQMYENKKVGYSFVSLCESIVTKVCESYGFDAGKYHHREVAKATLSNNGLGKSKKKLLGLYKTESRDNAKKDINALLEAITERQSIQIRDLYSEISKIRNSTAHLIRLTIPNKSFYNRLNKYINVKEVYGTFENATKSNGKTVKTSDIIFLLEKEYFPAVKSFVY
jgi:CRISPR-associated Csx2 family protein